MSYKYGIIKRQLESSSIDSEGSLFPSPTPTDSASVQQFETPVITPDKVTATITEIASSIVTTTVRDAAADTSNTTSSSTNVLVTALLGTIGLIIILSGLLFMIFWLKRGENKGVIGNRDLTQLNDDRRSLNDPTIDEMVTYRPSDPDDEQLPSYAEAVVRGRNSTIIPQ
ncbi:hypothetical protein C1645_829673 [Glomus cerebriforme]|uniref:Uncharacterized protein n=1 Tax=Glomus cerebriforme TaxID=658196 RepID=A0A397SU17_9GLOM|nr:hypothetical protein C1645_829673 [Glomus cerebriforme]